MARMKRFKTLWRDTWYHLYNKAAGELGEYPLAEPAARRKLAELLRHYAAIYMCRVAAFCIMGSHWHTVALFEAVRQLSMEELRRRAVMFHPGERGKKLIAGWGQAEWDRLNRRIFDVSEMMKDVQQQFTAWYNRRHNRVGPFWADRFKATVLEPGKAVLDACLYVDLNPVRAGIAERPEEHRGSSEHLRSIGRAGQLVPLTELTGESDARQARRDYRALLYWRGAVPTREGQAAIPERIIRAEEARGFRERGAFLRRIAYYREGLAVGSAEFAAECLEVARDLGKYVRRSRPIPQPGGRDFTLRPQRASN
jgi:hypothetical protein